MGLDITAYSNVRAAADEVAFDENGDLRDGYCELRINDSYPSHAGEIKDKCYEYDHVFDFRAGAYSSYNNWRDELAALAGYGSAKNVWELSLTGAFTELINFSDCDGTIGHQFASKLAKDFADFEAKAGSAVVTLRASAEFYQRYQKWRQAFELAAQNGAVRFH